MKYFVQGFRYDTGWDNGGEEVNEEFDTKEQAEEYILTLLTRKTEQWDADQIVVIHGEIVKFETKQTVIDKVTIL